MVILTLNKMNLKNKKIALGITGSISAYKACDLIRRLKEEGADVHCVLTETALSFITPLTLSTLSGNPVASKISQEMEHIGNYDLLIVAPATANLIGKAAAGVCDDLLTTIILARKSPVIIAPAMNEAMWLSEILVSNVKKLKEDGFRFVGPEKGRLTIGEGWGRLADVEKIVQEAIFVLGVKNRLTGKKILITAGATREAIDAVRFISNRSSGRMGHILAEEALLQCASVTLITTGDIPTSNRIETLYVETALEMRDRVFELFDKCDIFISVAAVSDFRPKERCDKKIKREDGLSLEFVKNPDILKEVSERKGKKMLIGFSVDSELDWQRAEEKLRAKNLDILVLSTTDSFASNRIKPCIIYPDGKREEYLEISKRELAIKLLEKVSSKTEN
ncbi:bifunctional phosphopantothenoylcysteine decarboxylase/phosphopantothenate--cysteine ligase CoaBC [bacterium]|nr:bifunctional phosphopantothenoylcysteine decarboxylase/phosphopantothenate--cysteine ligase CoaBC [bacterium]